MGRYVMVDGPYSDLNRYGDEVPEWTVCVMTDAGDEVGKVYRCRTYNKAVTLGQRMSQDRNLELVIEASPADNW